MSTKKTLNFRVEEELHEELKRIADETGRTLTDVAVARLEQRSEILVVEGKQIANELAKLGGMLKYQDKEAIHIREVCNSLIRLLIGMESKYLGGDSDGNS